MKASNPGISLFFTLLAFAASVQSQANTDAAAMQALKASLGYPSNLDWSDPDPCQWTAVKCSESKKVLEIRINSQSLKGTLPPDLKNLEALMALEVANNQLTGPIPSLSRLRYLQEVSFDNNNFSYIPPDFFTGLTSLQYVALDNNPFSSWKIPNSLRDAKALLYFSANEANISGTIPDIFGADTFPDLNHFHLASNNLQGQIPWSFEKSLIQTLWLYGQRSDTQLNGSLSVLQNMTSLSQLLLHDNHFTGPLPDLSALSSLEDLSLSDNKLTGIIPPSLVNLPKLTTINLTNNLLQGSTPRFNTPNVMVDIRIGSNSFCLEDPGVACDSRVNILLSIVESMSFPVVFAESWKGNDPCDNSQDWKGITCDGEGNITAINFTNLKLSGTISSNFSMLRSLQYLSLANNLLTGSIPSELTTLPSLNTLDVSNNHLHGHVPTFKENVLLIIDGNHGIVKYPDIVKDNNSSPGTTPVADVGGKNKNTGKILGFVIGSICGLFLVGLGVYLNIRKQKRSRRITIQVHSQAVRGPGGVHAVEFGNMVIPIQILRNATNNFREENKLGRGGFGTVYKGELNNGTVIAVKRMDSTEANEQGMPQFESEIAVLTKVQHRHLLGFLGYCLDGNERLLVYEYMPQGTLSRHLFKWKEEGLEPLKWNRRLNIALDVARGVEYLHGLAHQRFVHRDLKPSNILLRDDMRAKVADFGLVRLVPENGKQSIPTRLAGTFGYLAPEYVVSGRITVKVDVYSYGVILMELITGKTAVDATGPDPENVIHLVTWFREMHSNQDTFRLAIDQTIELSEENLASISTVAELACHCCASEPYQRPEMNHVVNVLSSLAESWKPIMPDSDFRYEIGQDMALTSKSSSQYSSTPEPITTTAAKEVLHHSV